MSKFKDLIDEYLKNNCSNILIAKSRVDFRWADIADSLEKECKLQDVDPEYVRGRWRKIFKPVTSTISTTMPNSHVVYDYKEDRIKGTAELKVQVDEKLSDDEIFQKYNVNKEQFKISQVWYKDKSSGGYIMSVLFTALKGKEETINYKKTFEDFINSLNIKVLNRDLSFLQNDKITNKHKENALVLSLADLHLDSKSFKEEIGSDGDIETSIQRAKDAVKDILYRAAEGHGLEKIIIIGGNDFFHANSAANTTQKGTPLDVDQRWHKSFKMGLNLMSWIIDLSLSFAPVDYYTCYGNHSPEREFYLAMALEALYRGNKKVNVETGESSRKYFSYGNSAFMLCHDAPKKIKDCPTIFITEQPQLYANAKYRFLLTGHLHSKNETFFIGTSENFGLLWKRLPSLAKSDLWHYDNFFVGNQKSCIGLVINKNHGEIAEYIYNE